MHGRQGLGKVYLLLTTYHLPLTTYYLLLATCHLLLTTCHLPLTTYCAALCMAGKVYATATEDMDALTFGSPVRATRGSCSI